MSHDSTPRIVIGGTRSGIGKTVLSLGLMQALRDSGMVVAPFKVGPDYIDPTFHKVAAGRPSRNLDSFMMRPTSVLTSFGVGSSGADIAVIEGVMGLFDSHNGVDEKGSTAEVAKQLSAPVILMVDVKKTARSAAAVVKGFAEFDPAVDLRGVVLNNVGSPRHEAKARRAVEELAGVEVLGALPSDASLHLPERHLGLVPAHEVHRDISVLAAYVRTHVDCDRIVETARSAPTLRLPEMEPEQKTESGKRVGILFDDAFRFYYPETLRQISMAATPVFIDALRDKRLPAVDVLYIGGGFPEVFAGRLERNASMREAVKGFCSSGGRVYAECGGLMYLGESIVTKEAEEFEMVGFLPLRTVMQEKYVGMGYTRNLVVRDTSFSRAGDVLVGHEFHHSKVELSGPVEFAYSTQRGSGVDGSHDGIIKKNVLASYTHLHPLGYRKMVGNLLCPAR